MDLLCSSQTVNRRMVSDSEVICVYVYVYVYVCVCMYKTVLKFRVIIIIYN